MADKLPVIHEHEGRLSGKFALPPADMPYIDYQGRVMLVLVADAAKITIGDTKDGTTKASWVFTAVDAAVVREDNMRTHLARTLYLDDEDGETPNFVTNVPLKPEGQQLEGVYDEEGAFLGFEAKEREIDTETGEILEETAAPTADAREEEVVEEGGELLAEEEEEIEPPKESLFAAKRKPDGSALPMPRVAPPQAAETYGRPVHYKDPVLAGFMEE